MPQIESGCLAAPVNVEILTIDNTQDTITFQTDARLVNTNNGSPEEERRVLGRFTCEQSQIWTPPAIWTKNPPVPDPSVQLLVGATGFLYLAKTALPGPGTSASGACMVRGWYPDANPAPTLEDEQSLNFKWPDCRPSDDWFPLTIQATSIKVKAFANGRLETVDLRDPALAQPDQDLDWNGASEITLQLNPDGLKRFGISANEPGPLRAWPIRIDVTGVPLSDTGAALSKASHTVDLRNQWHAARRQRLSWTAADRTVTTRLTTSGHGLFNIGPEDVKKALRRMLEVFRTSPGLEDDCRMIRAAGDALEAWHHALDMHGRLTEFSQLVTWFIEGEPKPR